MDPDVQARINKAIAAGYDPQTVMTRAAQLGLISVGNASTASGGNNIATASPTATEPSVGGFAQNIVNDTGQTLAGLGTAIMHPWNTVRTLASVPLGFGEKIGRNVAEAVTGNKSPDNVLPSEKTFNNVMQYIGNRYGSPDKIVNSLYNNPVSTALDAATALEGGSGVLGTSAKAANIAGDAEKAAQLSKAAEVARSASSAINPMNAAGVVVNAIKKIIPDQIASAISDYGSGLLSQQANNIDFKVVGAKLRPTFDKMANYGYTALSKFDDIASKITGKDGMVTNWVKDAVGKADPVNLGTYTDGDGNIVPSMFASTEELGNHPKLNGDPNVAGTEANKFVTDVKQELNKINKPVQTDVQNSNGQLKSNDILSLADPTDAWTVMKKFENNAYDDTGLPNNVRKAYKAVADELKDRIFGSLDNPKANQYVKNNIITPENVDRLRNMDPNNPKWQNAVDDFAKIGQSDNPVRDLRSFQQPFTNASKIADAETELRNSSPQNLPNSGGNIVSQAGQAILRSKWMSDKLGGFLHDVKVPVDLNNGGIKNPAILAATNVAYQSPVSGGSVNQPVDNKNATYASDSQSSNGSPTNLPTDGQSEPTINTKMAWSPEAYSQAVMADSVLNGGKNISAFSTAYNALSRPDLQPERTSYVSALQSIDQAEKMLKENIVNPTSLGPIGSTANALTVKAGGKGDQNLNAFAGLTTAITNDYLRAEGGVRGVDAATLRQANASLLPTASVSKEANLTRLKLLKQAIVRGYNNTFQASQALPTNTADVNFGQ